MRTKLLIASLAGASLVATPVVAQAASAPASVASNPAASLSIANVAQSRASAPRGKSRGISGAAIPIAILAAVAIGVGTYLAVDGSSNPASR